MHKYRQVDSQQESYKMTGKLFQLAT